MSNPAIFVRVSQDLHDAVGKVAADYGRKRPGWVADLLANVIDGRELLRRDELAALSESNRMLWALGTNLNQIARALNISRRQGAALSPDAGDRAASLFAQALEKIEAHTADVSALLAHSRVTRTGRQPQ